MPVHIEWIESPTEQDWLDLNKLYKGAPQHWFAQTAQQTAQAYVNEKQQKGYKIVAGRFNDRLIAAAALKLMDQKLNSYQIEELCVRDITRQRGVARQLLVRLCQWSDKQKCGLWIEDDSARLKVLLEFGFVHNQGKWFRQG